MVTIYDIAKELNISPSTVSRSFSDPGLVKEKTRKRVLEKAQEMGYQVNMVASQLRNQSSNIIALVSLQKEWSWFTDTLANGLQDVAHENGYELFIINGNNEYMRSISVCEKMRFAGMIVASTELGIDVMHYSSLLPVVYVNRIIEDECRVLLDDEHDIGQGMDYLRKMGHTRIGFINGPKSSLHSELRFQMYRKKMHDFGLTIQGKWIRQTDWSDESAYRAAVEILSAEEIPTAIVGFNDQMCCGIYRAILEKGMFPGRELSVLGYDDREYSRLLIPPLTTLSLPLYKIGRTAGEMLFQKIKGEEVEKEVRIWGKLIERNSVGRLA